MRTAQWTGVVLLAIAWPLMATAERDITVGEVESIQLLDASPLGGGEHLLLVLADGQGFRLPGASSAAVSAGMRVEVQHRPPADAEKLPAACVVRVLAVPLERGGEASLKRAERPFAVYRNEIQDDGC